MNEAGVPDGRRRSRRELLASDADRERTIELLKSAFSEGRLSADEHDERVGRAYISRTYGELADLTADLPPESGGSLPAVSPVYQPFPPAYSPAVPPSYHPVPPAYHPVPPPYHPVPRSNNGQAVASLLLGLACLPVGLVGLVAGTADPLFALPAVGAVVLGYTGRIVIRRSGEGGDSAAAAGAVLGYLGVFFWVLCLLRHGGH